MFADADVALEVTGVLSHEEPETYALSINVNCCHLGWQVPSAAQISNLLSQMLSAVEHLGLGHREHSQSSEGHDEVDPAEWLKLLRSFRNVKTLCIGEGLVKELSRCLEEDGGALFRAVARAARADLFWVEQYRRCIYFNYLCLPERRLFHNPDMP